MERDASTPQIRVAAFDHMAQDGLIDKFVAFYMKKRLSRTLAEAYLSKTFSKGLC